MPIKEMEIKLQYEKPYTSYDCKYDEFAFVFYFPSDSMQMNCPEQAMICKEVPHNTCATKGYSCPGRELPAQLKLKLEIIKKRREENSENVAVAQNVSPQAKHDDDTESPLEEEFYREEGGMTHDQEHVMQQLEEEDLFPACEDH